MRSSACVPFSRLPSDFSPPSANSATAMPSASLQRGLEGFREPLPDIGAHHDAVHHHVDIVLEFLVERRGVRDLVIIAVDLQALEAALHPVGDFLAVFAFAVAHDRREDIKPRAFGQRQHAVDHLRDGLALDREAGRGRIGHADARPQQPHVIVDFGDGADGRARIARGGLLLDGNGGREAVDLVDIRLLHHLQELPRIGRERLDVAALALGIDGVEGERGLARAGQAGEHHQRIARDVEIDVLEIVLARAPDGDDAHVGAGRASFFLSNRSFIGSTNVRRGVRFRRERMRMKSGVFMCRISGRRTGTHFAWKCSSVANIMRTGSFRQSPRADIARFP